MTEPPIDFLLLQLLQSRSPNSTLGLNEIVLYFRDDGRPLLTKTRSNPWKAGDIEVISLAGVVGAVDCRRVVRVNDIEISQSMTSTSVTHYL